MRPPLEETPARIAVFLPNWVGDAVMATPALRALREHFASSRIVYVGRPATLAVLAGSPWADGSIREGSKDAARFLPMLHAAGAIRKEQPDLGILLPNSFRSALLGRLAGIRRLAGYARGGRSWLLCDKLSAPSNAAGYIPTPAIDYYNALMCRLGVPARSHRMELPVLPQEQAQADELLRQAAQPAGKAWAMINPGAGFGPSKLWPAGRYAALADALIERHGLAVIVNAAPAERPVAEQVVRRMRHSPAIDLGRHDNSIGLVKGLMHRCSLLVTNDTGARHIGAAMGINVVTVFGSTDPDWTTIYYDRERIIRSDAPCAPCQRKMCRQPPGPHYHQCMQAIGVEQVLKAAEELLASPGGAIGGDREAHP